MARRNRIQLYFAFMDWKQAVLTGLPHLLYILRLLIRPASAAPAWEQAVSGLFALTILAGLVYGLRLNPRKPPRWVGSWAGYGLLLALELVMARLTGSPAGTFGGILWLAGYSAALIYLGRGDRMRAVLAALPVAPVFIWSMTLDLTLAAGSGSGPAAGPVLAALVAAGLVMAVASALFEGFIWGRQIFWTVMLATLLGGLPVAYANQLRGSGTVDPPGLIASLLGYLVAVGVFSWPAWVGGFWDWIKSKLTHGV
jgi:hypothetical protein